MFSNLRRDRRWREGFRHPSRPADRRWRALRDRRHSPHGRGRVGLRASRWGLPQRVGRAETWASVVITRAFEPLPDTESIGGD